MSVEASAQEPRAKRQKRSGFSTVTPYLVLDDAVAGLELYKKAFGAVETYKVMRGDKVGHAELEIGDSRVMLATEHPGTFLASPKALGGTTTHIYLYVEDVDKWAERVVDNGFECLMPVQDEVDGDRRGGFRDPFGHIWWLATHLADVSSAEVEAHYA
eukprot:CAMPEP_0197389446 /NCGR_PEP_ID=MMETSP1165-20131217/1716_1 /TAXON_ID=284809 /ORGANISM="Chrysocystis fragilis, Strain CCMP3189" /LENGTH=157 /DNA_ID=CAMNT_0042914863 /DNA_START=25 /DNA_END=495 /DNA_ORIENTATION=-